MDKRISESLKSLIGRISLHEQETVAINFALGDLLNSYVDCSAESATGASLKLDRDSGINYALFLNYARIARRIPEADRPKKVPWGAIKYIVSDLNPRRFRVNEERFVRAAVEALKEIERRDLKLVDLKVVSEGEWTIGEQILREFL
ncbi:MAG: hypothetical protein KDN05_16915 [Verrucomicrobiae bacterium]|nr:hypothetical protein [Verrucomicrobiae bacterium]